MQREEDQQLWELLGSGSRPPAPSPFFARDVLRRIREQSGWEKARNAWLNWRRLLPLSGLVAATAAILVAYTLSFHATPAETDDAVAKIDAQDYEVVADLDDLLASDENNLWDDNSSL